MSAEISEATLHNFFSNSEAIPLERRAGTAARLNRLRPIAYLYFKASSRQTRTKLDASIKRLRSDIKNLQESLKMHDHIIRPLELAKDEIGIVETTINKSVNYDLGRDPTRLFIELSDLLDHLGNDIALLDNAVKRYDKNINCEDDLIAWIDELGSGMSAITRARLGGFIAKGNRLQANTYVLKRIAKIYEYAFGCEFSIKYAVDTPEYNTKLGQIYLDLGSQSNSNSDPELKDRDLISAYAGTSLNFAADIILSLDMTDIFLSKRRDDHEDERLIFVYDRTSKYYVRLLNHIGDLWTNRIKEAKKAMASSKASKN